MGIAQLMLLLFSCRVLRKFTLNQQAVQAFLLTTVSLNFQINMLLFILYIVRLMYNGHQLVKGASLDLLYSSADQGSRFSRIFSTDPDPCPVSTYIHYDNSIKPQWTSLYTRCIDIHVSSLIFPGLATQLMIPATTNTGPDSTDIVASVWSNNRGNKSIPLGKFISFPTSNSPGAYLEMYLTTEERFTGVLHQAAMSLFDTTFNTDIVLKENQLSFTAQADIFGYYSTNLTGTASLNDEWKSLVLDVDGVMNKNEENSFVSELEEYIHGYIEMSALEAAMRRDIAGKNLEKAAMMVQAAENVVAIKQSTYDTLSAELDQLTSQRDFWTQIKNEKEETFDNFVAIYNIPQSEFDAIDAICNETECGQLCQYDMEMVQCGDYADTPIYRICSQEVTGSVQDHTLGNTTVYICEDAEQCNTNLGVQWTTIDSIFLPFPSLIKQCFSACELKTRIEEAIEFETINDIKMTYVACEGDQKSVPSMALCWNNATCGAYLDEEPCLAINQECIQAKKQATIDISGATGTGLLQLDKTLEDYIDAYGAESAAKADVYKKTLEKEIARQELFMAMEARDSAKMVELLSISANDSVINSQDPTYTEWLNNYNSAANIVQLNSISFSTTASSSTPSKLLLRISYVLPYLNSTEYEKETEVDLSDSVEMVKDKLLEFIIASVIADEMNQPSKRAAETSAESILAIKYGCASLQWLLQYLEWLNSTLTDSHLSTTSLVQYLSEEVNTIQEQVDEALSASDDISDTYRISLQQYQLDYLSQATESYTNMRQSVIDTNLHYWILNIEQYHDGGITLADSDCFSLTDCLFAVFKESGILLNPVSSTEANNLKANLSMQYTIIESIADDSDMNIFGLQEGILSLYEFVKSIDSLGFWCSSEPIITIHPDPEVYAALGDTVTLSCEANSSLPLLYQWLKDDVLITGYNSSNLIIDGFQESDEGTYVCQAVDGITRISSLSSIVRSYQPPVITVEPLDYATYAGDESGVRFECEAESSPLPYWSWYYRGSDNDTWSLVDNATSNVFVIEKPNLSHEGWYQCEAKNEFSSTRSSPAQLLLLHASVTTRRYPMQFAIDASQANESFHNTTVIMAVFEEFLQNQLKAGSAAISDINVWPYSTPNQFIVYFELSSIPVLVENFTSAELESIVSNTMEALKRLETSRSFITTVINDSPSYSTFRIIDNTLIQHTVKYYCSEGEELTDNYFICSECTFCHTNVTKRPN